MKTPVSSKKASSTGKTSSTTKASISVNNPSKAAPAKTSKKLNEDDNNDDYNINKLLPRMYELNDNETLLATGFLCIVGHNNSNCRFVFIERGSHIRMQVKVPQNLMTVSGLLDGFTNCTRGTQWYPLAELVIDAIYGPQEPSTPTGEDAWKTMFYYY
jgi:hypothetical protein